MQKKLYPHVCENPECGKQFFGRKNTRFCCVKCSRKISLKPDFAAQAKVQSESLRKKAKRERDTFGLTLAQRQEVIDAQDGDPSLLWKRSQTWTMNQRNFAKKRYLEMHDVLSHA